MNNLGLTTKHKMIKFTDFDIVFGEIPDEVTLAIHISLCPNLCEGCHSPQLREDIGYLLDDENLAEILLRYAADATCVCFMGGDNDPQTLALIAHKTKELYPGMKTGWYSGKCELPHDFDASAFDYVKVGPYIPEYGPLNKPTTNQRLYHIVNGEMVDITSKFWKK